MSQRLLQRFLRAFIRLFLRPALGPKVPVGFQRRWTRLLAATNPPPRGPQVERLEAGGVPLYRLRWSPDGEPESEPPPGARPALLYVHGGNFIIGDFATYRGIASHISRAAGGIDVYLPEYRLAPEHPYPAATDDLFAAWRAILDRGHDPGRLAIAGDSAGGCLAVATALEIAEMETPSPAALVLLSPVTDLTQSGTSMETNAKLDPMLTRAALARGARAYAGPIRRSDPRLSPLFADIRGLPPTLIQVGEDEVLLDDAVRFADRAWAGGVDVELERFPGLWHDFQINAGTLVVADGAVGDIGAFLQRRWGDTAPAKTA